MTDIGKLIEKLLSDNDKYSLEARGKLNELIEVPNKVFQALLYALDTGDTNTRMTILNYLEYMPGPPIETAVERSLHTETDREVKLQAIRTMRSRLLSTSNLIALCHDDNEEVRTEALSALNYFDDFADTVNVFAKSLVDGNSDVRLTAAYALEGVKGAKPKFPEIAPLLKEIEKNSNETEFWEEYSGLEYSMKEIFPDYDTEAYDIPELQNLISTVWEKKYKGEDSEVISLLLEMLDHVDPRIRLSAIMELGEIYSEIDLDEGEVIVDAFIKMLSDMEAPIRDQAVTSLFETGSEKTQDALMPMQEDPDANVRHNAKWSLKKVS